MMFPSILELLLLLSGPAFVLSYPVFGTKRYGRTPVPQWGPLPVWRAAPPVPARYYEQPYIPPMYVNDEEFYYPHPPAPSRRRPYPVYSRNEVYESLLPYYYAERRPAYEYEEQSDPVDDIQDEIMQEERDREEREDALPIGQETWFENSEPRRQDTMEEANESFLRNLIMSNMYNDAVVGREGYPRPDVYPKDPRMDMHPTNHRAGVYPKESSLDMYSKDSHNKNTFAKELNPKDPLRQESYLRDLYSREASQYPDDYEDSDAEDLYDDRKQRDFEDEDVKELKSLAGKPLSHVPKTHPQDMEKHWNPEAYSEEPTDDDWINWGSKRSVMDAKTFFKKHELKEHGSFGPSGTSLSFNDRKKSPSVTTSTASSMKAVPVTDAPTASTRNARGGQKEVVQPRPATPVRHHFTEPIIQMLDEQSLQEKRSTPNVYDTIKQLLAMEKELYKNEDTSIDLQPRIKKRFVNNEESLVHQLSGLKRRAV